MKVYCINDSPLVRRGWTECKQSFSFHDKSLASMPFDGFPIQVQAAFECLEDDLRLTSWKIASHSLNTTVVIRVREAAGSHNGDGEAELPSDDLEGTLGAALALLLVDNRLVSWQATSERNGLSTVVLRFKPNESGAYIADRVADRPEQQSTSQTPSHRRRYQPSCSRSIKQVLSRVAEVLRTQTVHSDVHTDLSMGIC